MMTTLTIHRKSGDLEVGVNQGSIRRYNLMSEDFIKLKFSLSENIPLLIGDFVDLTDYLHDCDNENFKGEIDPVTGELRDETTKLFVLNRNYYPTFNKETGGWDYDVQIDAYYKQWANRILKFIPDSEDASAEASFSLTDTIENHAGIIIRNLKHAGFTYKGTEITCEIEPQVIDKGIQLISYQSIDILSAINLIATTYKCEWWMDGGATLWFGFRKKENKLSLTMNEEIHDASTSDSDGTHATRLYAFGGTTNVPEHYRDKIEFTVTEATSQYILDENKPIRPWMFAKLTEADAFSQSFSPTSTDSTSIMRDDTLVNRQELSIGTIHLDGGQWYKGEVSGVSPNILFRKLMVYGSSTKEFTINFNYTYKLVSSQETIILGKENGYDASITSTIYDIMGDMYGVSELDKWFGLINSNHKLYSSKGAPSDAFRMYDPNAAESIMAEVESGYYSGSKFAQFLKPSTDNATWKQLEVGDVLEPLFPVDTYTKGHAYTMLLQGYPDTGTIITHGIQNGSSRVSYGHNQKSFRLGDVNREDVWFSVEHGGDYELKLIVETTSATGVSWYESKDNHTLVFDVTSPTINISLQPSNAQSAATKIMSNGETYNAVINYWHEYAGNDMDVASGTLGSSKIRVIGNPLKVGDKFTLPYILRSKVPGHYYDATNKGVQSAVVQRNIMLPEGELPYVQAEGVSDDEVVEAIVVYDWIYPKTNIEVLRVAPTTYPYGEGEEVDTYEITIGIKNFVWANMVTNNGDLHAIFQNEEAAGLRFELEEVESKKTTTTATFKLIPNEDYSVIIPNKATDIKVGDEVILDGINIQYFDENAVTNAENAVKAQAMADLEKMCKEDKVVDITLRSDYAYNQGRLPLGSAIDLHGILSSRVDKDDNLIPYESRIIGFEEKLDIPYDSPKYIVGDSNYYSTIGSIETKLEEVNMGSFALSGVGGKGGNGIPIIRSVDNTYPTDGNVYSAKRTDKQFLNKHEDEQVNGNIQFEKGISVNGGADIDNADINDVNVGNKANIRSLEVVDSSTIGGVQTIKGDQTVQGTQTLHKGFITHNFNEAGGQIVGAQLTDNGIMTVAGLKAMSLEVFELIYNTIKAQGGKFAFSNSANIEYATYEMIDGRTIPSNAYNHEDWVEDGNESTGIDGIEYVYLKLKKDDAAKGVPFVNGDIIYGYVSGIGESGQYARYGQCVMYVINPLEGEELEDMVVKARLFPIGDVNTNSGVVSSNIPPADGIAVAQRGNIDPENNPTRLTSFFVDTETANLYMLSNVTSPVLNKSNYAVVNGQLPTDLYNEIKKYFSFIKPYDPVSYARYGIFENILQFDHLGQPIQRENNRGEWLSGEAYYNTVSYYDTVTYEGELWKCVADVTYDAPSNSNDWLLLVAKGKDKPMPNENLLDNTLRFDDNWTLGTSSLYKAEVEDGEDGRKVLHCTGRNMNLPFAKQFITGVSVEGGVNKVVADEWYTLSFELKGTRGGVRNVLSDGIVDESEVVYIDGVEQSYTDNMNVASTENWVRHSYTFKTVSAIPADAFVGFTFTMLSDFYLDKIKLERGKEVTPWTTSANDGIGKQGADGVSVEIVSTTVRYASHDSGSARPSDDKWSEILPSVADGLYLWTWTRVVYSTGDTTDSYSVSRMGIDGKGIQSAVVTYCERPNTNVKPEDFAKEFGENIWGDFPTSLTDGYWLYSRTITTYSDGSASESYSVTQNGQGSYYAGLQEYYAPSASPTIAPTGYPQEGTYPKDAEMTITGSWDKVRPSLVDATPYLWNFSVSFDSKGNRYVVAPVCIGNFAKGIKSIVETYAISAYSKPNGDGRYPTDIASWTDEAQDAAPTEEKPYQWNKTETTYNDDSTEQFYHVSAVKGEKGDEGKDGRGISSVSMEYAVTTTFEQPSLGSDEWKPERPSIIAEGSYLWTKTIVDYTDDSAVDTVGVTVSRIGANGTSVSVSKTEYVESASATTAPTSGWSTSIPSVDEGNYLWTRTTFSDGKVAYSVAKNGKSLTIKSIKYSSVLNSSTQPTESTFTLNTMPTTKQGDYLWTLTTYSDGTKDYSKSYIPNDGVGINSTTISYGKSKSASVKPAESEWQQDIPTVGEDEYLWTRTIIDYTDSTDTVSYTYSHQGKTGQAGTSVSVKSIKYQAGDSATTAPTGTWSDNVVEVPQGGYLWTKTEFSDGSTAYGSARQGSDGKDGLTAQPNIIRNSNFDLNDGTYLKFWRNYWVDGIVNGTAANDKSGELPISEYVVSNAHEGLNAIKYNVPTSGHLFVSKGDAKITLEKGYIYTFSCVAKYTGQSTNSSGGIFGVRFESLPLSAITPVGDNDDIYGVGGSSHTEIYFGKVGDEWTKRSFTFSLKDSYENDSAVFRLCGYAWGKDITVYYSQIKLEISHSATPYVKHVDDNKGEQGIQGLQGLQGPKGDQGIQGLQGPKGDNSYFHIKYASDNKGTGMNDVGGEYIGTYTDNVAQDSNDPSKYTWVLVKGAQGEKGDQGIKGENGEDGTSSYLHIAYANSSDGSVDFSVSDSNRKYIGQYIDTLVNDSTDYRSYKWSHIEGPQGLTPQPNILHNTNFDVLDANGNLVNWQNIAGDVIPNGYLSYNSFKTKNTGTRARIQLPTMKKGDVFTFSCVARIGGTESVYCGGITINNSSITSRNLVGIYTPMWNATDFCFKNTSEWTERRFTFEYTGDSELSGALLSLYVWGGWCEYSTIKLEKGEDATPYIKHVDDNKGDQGPQGPEGQRGAKGDTGPAGKAGPMLYPAGTWTAGVTYKKDGDSVPYVYYDADEDDEIDGLYYILKTDEVTSSNSPAEDTTNWRAMEQKEVVYAKFLMANFAKFGSNNGGVFYDRYLFSQKGENRNGREVSYTKDMFDEYGDLTGNFIPAMLLDFLSGEAVFQKLTELYHRYEAGTGLVKMDKYYNIIVTPKVLPFGYPSEQGYCTPLVILPQLNYVNNLMKNGTHVSIFADLGDYYEAADEEEGIWPLSGTNRQMSTFALISADDVTKGLGIDTRGKRTGNWIVADGYRSKFLLLSPGNMLKLRLAINENTSLSGDESYYWIVENRSVDVCKGQLFATPLLDHESWIPTDPLNFNDFYNEASGYNVERIRSVKTLRQDNWRAGDDVNHPYTPVLLSVGDVGYNIDVTDGNKQGYYAGLTEPNIILSTAKYTKASDGTWEGGWYSNCCYRLLNRTESRKYTSAEDGGWPTIDEKTMTT